MKNQFRRIRQHAWMAGVLGGLAYAMKLPAWIVRLSFVVLTMATGGTLILAYLLFAMFAPSWESDPLDYERVCM